MKMRVNSLTCNFVNLVNVVLCVGVILFLLFCVYMLLTGPCQFEMAGYSIDINDIMKFGAFTLPLSIASIQLSRHIAQSSITNIIELRNAFDEESMKLVQEWCASKKHLEVQDIDILNFLGYIEIGSIMLQKGLINECEFEDHFNALLQWALSNPEIYQHILDYPNYYTNLLFVIYIFEPDVYARLNLADRNR